MNSSSPGAFALSALLHAALIGLVLFFSYAATSVVEDNPKVFELVAGAGDNYAATAAPALGSPGGIKVKALPQETPRRRPLRSRRRRFQFKPQPSAHKDGDQGAR